MSIFHLKTTRKLFLIRAIKLCSLLVILLLLTSTFACKKNVDYFDGKDGVDGKTPVKGVDYFTDADKNEVANLVKAMISETWTFTLTNGSTVNKTVVIK